jgi:uncharacterized membrane protein
MTRTERAKSVTRVVVALAMVGVGVTHFTNTHWFEQIVPPFLPNPRLLVQLSGVFEMLGGLGVLVPPTRKLAGIGLVLLYVAVFPANIYMAIEPVAVDGVVPDRWLVWARLPFQFLFMWLAWWCTRPPNEPTTSSPSPSRPAR